MSRSLAQQAKKCARLQKKRERLRQDYATLLTACEHAVGEMGEPMPIDARNVLVNAMHEVETMETGHERLAGEILERCEEAERERDEALWRLGVLREAVENARDGHGDYNSMWEALKRVEESVPAFAHQTSRLRFPPSVPESHLDRANLAAANAEWQAATYWAVRALMEDVGQLVGP